MAIVVLMLVAFAGGWVLGHFTATPLRGDTVAHDESDGSLRHTIDHRCSPPFSRWSSVSDAMCFVDVTKDKSDTLLPGDVWVCPDCLMTWVLRNGQWQERV